MKNPALRVAVVSALCNVALVALKYPLGLYFGSGALISDAIHSLTDVLCNVIVIAGIYLAAKKPDELHRFGHSRFESIASMILSVILFSAGFSIGKDGITSIIFKSYVSLEAPGLLAFAAAFFSVVLKEILFRYTSYAAEKTNSAALKADAHHHRIDSVATLGSIAGMGGAFWGLPVLDPIASVFISLFIVKTAVELFLSSSRELSDRACPLETQKKILLCCKENGAVVESMRTRCCSSQIYCELTLSVAPDAALSQLKTLEEQLCKAILSELKEKADIIIRFRCDQ